MSKLISDGAIDPETLEFMRKSPYTFTDTRWAAYQNHDLGHYNVGHLQFLATGPRNTVKEAPTGKLPDYQNAINWRYYFVGFVNLETGKIEEPPTSKTTEGDSAGSAQP